MRRMTGALLAAALACVHTARADGLDPTEQKIVAAVKAHAPQALALLEQSVRINSGTMNARGVRDVGQLFRKAFDDLGFSTRWIDMPPGMHRAGHLVATRDGNRGKRVLLLGHLDTVFEPGSPVPAWQQGAGDGRVRGQGVSDMKGGDVIVIEALRALQRAGALDGARIAVMFTGDEEEAGNPKSVSRGDMVELAKRSDVALSFESNIPDNEGQATATVGRRATATWELQVQGRQGHSMGVFGTNGYGAVYETARILDAFRREVAEPGLTFNPGVILGGTDVTLDDANSRGTAFGKTNVIANTTVVKADLRYLDYPQRDRAQARMRDIVAHSLPGTSATIAFHDSYPPMAVTPGNLKLLDLYARASQDAGLGTIGAVPAEARGAGDIQFVAPLVDSLDGLGASGHGAHSPDEDLDVASIERGAVRAALLIYRLTR
ncbi:M20/M25/M40 family metallo-hydrolase [Massilia pinisoli]|uniref:M20/M25/M40 family metallo-hydrolase n=1 Tax=Massilia pinisoli TaxID=1772194 RepID=A0ABT1ZW37_9BURK|nr:M20/M25/M40 family metallo-hydrolase [Massilia pinisoli]MCS0584156.1 M20/M25/M40 family metallo-hydrolase [Massilia pinisoli]